MNSDSHKPRKRGNSDDVRLRPRQISSKELFDDDDDDSSDAAARRSNRSSTRDVRPPNPKTLSSNKSTIDSTAETDPPTYGPCEALLLLRASPTIEDFAKLGAVESDSDDGEDFWRGGGRGGEATTSIRAKRMQQLPPPSPPRRKQVTVGQRRASVSSSSNRRKSQTGEVPPPPVATTTSASAAAAPPPFWSLNRMRSSSTDSVRGAFYSQRDLPSRNAIVPGHRRSTGADELPPSSSAANRRHGVAAAAAAAEEASNTAAIGGVAARRRSIPKRRIKPKHKQVGPEPVAPPPSTTASNRRFFSRGGGGGRGEDAGGSSNSYSSDDDDDDRIGAAELGRAGGFHDNDHKGHKPRRSSRKPPRDVPSKIVRYGAAAHDDENQPNLPAPPTGGESTFQRLASSAPSSYQWTISPREETSQPNHDQLSTSQLPPLRLSIGEEYVPLHPPAAHRSFAVPPPAQQGSGSDGSGFEASSASASHEDAWSSASEFRSHHTSDGANSRSLFRFDGSEQPSAVGCFGGGGIARWIARWLDPTPWLTRDVRYREDSGAPYFEPRACWTVAGSARHLLWNPIQPEFTSLQLFNWAIVVGVVMGFYTAAWKALIEACIDLLWVTVPTRLLQLGFFTSLEGSFPLYHYMWMCPSVLGGILTCAITYLPDKIPDQNDWIRNVHTRGTQDHASFLSLFVIATAGMASGLSLGPELPLVLTAGMAGSWLGLVCKQSVLQARVMNLTAASAAVGGFFGFPMAGALFVLEIPHRMGLQYFEALSPATVSSIVAVLTNRLVVGNDVTGYYSYPFLTTTLPSGIFTSSIVYGFFGAAVGVAYAVGCKKFKTVAHDLFPTSPAVPTENPSDEGTPRRTGGEKKPLLERQDHKKHARYGPSSPSVFLRVCRAIRIASAGCLVGAIVGGIGMFIPHSMFWGEAQLQTLIDKGRTPLPVFGVAGEATADLVALGRCMIDGRDAAAVRAGFGIQCSFAISVAKVITTGLSLGTGIVGGHFWGPLFVGCSSGHFLTEVVRLFSEQTGYGGSLSRYPCLVILCVMGSAHVVTYRAHMAIMLILTLTISAFNPEDGATGSVAGDYSAVFPLLVVSVFVALMLTRSTVFYPTQRSRGDIIAVPEVLCEPGMAGRPMVHDYEMAGAAGDTDESYETDDDDDSNKETQILNSLSPLDIEENFEKSLLRNTPSPTAVRGDSPARLSSLRLDELLSKPLEFRATKAELQRSTAPPFHRRIWSDPARGDHRVPRTPTSPSPSALDHGSNSSVSQAGESKSARAMRYRSQSGASVSSPKTLVRIKAYGEVQDLQPSLLDQARLRAASSADDSYHKSQGFHSRNNSLSSVGTASSVVRVPSHPSVATIPRNSSRTRVAESVGPTSAVSEMSSSRTEGSGALTLDDFDQNFDAQLASMLGGHHRTGGSRSG